MLPAGVDFIHIMGKTEIAVIWAKLDFGNTTGFWRGLRVYFSCSHKPIIGVDKAKGAKNVTMSGAHYWGTELCEEPWQ